MKNIIELNDKEISLIVGGSRLGDWFGTIGSVVGLGLGSFALAAKGTLIFTKAGSWIPERFAKVALAATLTQAGCIFIVELAGMLSTSYIFATCGNILSKFGEILFGTNPPQAS